ncbi:hypothetical protein DIPPA_20349 [Diplonema papillatum]|nr:hypothetical protein DIPPA_20349 [Diplonema papillatum]KAJ9461981.1 hypothetical protein DIPPA_20349 [Diplonema papillatum]KAJ9461982.1 hypothetical protein DIPPA_20349 [Diplonema papillatum]
MRSALLAAGAAVVFLVLCSLSIHVEPLHAPLGDAAPAAPVPKFAEARGPAAGRAAAHPGEAVSSAAAEPKLVEVESHTAPPHGDAAPAAPVSKFAEARGPAAGRAAAHPGEAVSSAAAEPKLVEVELHTAPPHGSRALPRYSHGTGSVSRDMAYKIRESNRRHWLRENKNAMAQQQREGSKQSAKSTKGEWHWLAGPQNVSSPGRKKTAARGPLMSARTDALLVQGGQWWWKALELPDMRQHGFTEYRARSAACQATGAQKERPGNCWEQFGYITYLSDFAGTVPVPEFVVFFHRSSDAWITPKTVGALVKVIDKGLELARQTNRIVSLTQHEISPLRDDIVRAWNRLFHDDDTVQIDPSRLSDIQHHPCLTQFVVPRDHILSSDGHDSDTPSFRTAFFTRLHQFQQYDLQSNAAFFRQMYPFIFRVNYTIQSVMDDPAFAKQHASIFLRSSCRAPTEETVGQHSETGVLSLDRFPEVVHEHNALGMWSYRRDGEYVGKALAVIGGAVEDSSLRLIEKGWVVWLPGTPCTDRFSCTENYGYFSYLVDDDPAKPVAPYVAFLHGHNNSRRHQRFVDVLDLLDLALACAERSRRFTTVYRVPTWRREFVPEIDAWNKLFHQHRRVPRLKELHHYCCSQFVVPWGVVAAAPAGLYRDLFWRTLRGDFGGLEAELTYHLVFNESDSLDLTEDMCEPPLPPAFDQFAVDAAGQHLPSSALEANRIGVRRRVPGADVDVVFGNDYPSEVVGRAGDTERLAALAAAFQKAGHNVWVRRPLLGVHNGSRTETKGYLTYLAYDIERAPYAVFLHGDEDPTDGLLAAVANAVDVIREGALSFMFLEHDRTPPGDNPARLADRLNAVWKEFFEATGHSSVRCGAGFRRFEASALASEYGTRFVIRTELIERRIACISRGYVKCDFDYTGEDSHLFDYFWKRFLSSPPSKGKKAP